MELGDIQMELHGKAILKIINYSNSPKVSRLHSKRFPNAFYQVQLGKKKVILLLKYSRQGYGNRFHFDKKLTNEIIRLKKEKDSTVFIGLVRQREGVCVISSDELFWLVENKTNYPKTIQVIRSGSFSRNSVESKDRRVAVPMKDFPRRLFK